jgi:crotonobetainyl-CoA:carnitine CoA-transferase CaiB-like acyl-CoA transferase
MPNPLDKIRVLDLTRLLPGAVATMMLGDFGAEVVKIEEPGAGEPMRHMPPLVEGEGAYFLATHRNKRSAALNLKHEAGRAAFLRLVEQADVVVESFRPGVMARLGLGYESLRGVNPRLIYCAVTGYGQDGPYAGRAGHDINYIAVAGLLGLNGGRGGEPTIPGVQMADLAGGALQAVVGILLALAARERTGRGQMVDISMTDGALSLMIIQLAAMFATGRTPERGAETLTGRFACYHVYETGDGRHVALGALEPKFWAAACRVLGCEELIAAQFAGGEEQARSVETVQQIFRRRSAAEWLEVFAAADACLELVGDPQEAINHPQIAHRCLISELDHPAHGPLKQIAPTARLSETPADVRRAPPRLGEHTREVLGEVGYSDDEIERMKGEGAAG